MRKQVLLLGVALCFIFGGQIVIYFTTMAVLYFIALRLELREQIILFVSAVLMIGSSASMSVGFSLFMLFVKNCFELLKKGAGPP